jgi:hypothetical protein
MRPSMEMIGQGNVMDWLRTGAALLGAVGTVGAVVLALWLQWFRVERRRPSLTLDFNPTLDRVNVPQRAEDPQEPRDYRSHWLRPRVTNKPGGDSAEDVEVVLVGVEPLDSETGRSSQRERNLEGLSLKWSEVKSEKASIPPGVTRHIDLVHVDNMRVERDRDVVKREEDKEDRGEAPIRVDVYPTPQAKYYRVFRPKCRLLLAVTARDTNASFYSTVVKYDLKRRNDMNVMQEKLMVERFKGPKSDPSEL